MNNTKLYKVPNASLPYFEDVCDIMSAMCKAKLNEEYFDLGVALAAKIARKRPSPLLSSSSQTWAVGIIHALGMVNFLFDKSQSPHLSSKELSEWFGLSQNTINAKSQSIRKMFNIYQMEPEWCLPSKAIDNPWIWMVAFDGYIVDVRNAPYAMQQAAYEAGAIPFIPDKTMTKTTA